MSTHPASELNSAVAECARVLWTKMLPFGLLLTLSFACSAKGVFEPPLGGSSATSQRGSAGATGSSAGGAITGSTSAQSESPGTVGPVDEGNSAQGGSSNTDGESAGAAFGGVGDGADGFGGHAGAFAIGGGPGAGGSSHSSSSNGGSAHGGASQGGSRAVGGAANVVSNGTGGRSNGGASNGGASSGGASSGGASNGGASNGGASNGGAPNGGAFNQSNSQVFKQARFHFGTIDSIAKKAGASMIAQLDFFTSGWLQGDTFDHSGVCDDTKPGGALSSLVPVLVAYVSASHVKRLDKTMCDCNVTASPCVATNDLCHQGAARIAQDFSSILSAYQSYSTGFAKCYGTTRPIVFEMEPDWYQYTGSSQSAPWTAKQAGQMLGQLVSTLKSALPNALFSIDVSPWVAPNNGTDNGATWYSNFDLTQFTFVSTSGGGTNGNSAKIRNSNNMTWAGLSKVTGKPILADTGYGANGVPAGEDPAWNVAANINARIADGVLSISQYSPSSNWGSTIALVRDQLQAPKVNP